MSGFGGRTSHSRHNVRLPSFVQDNAVTAIKPQDLFERIKAFWPSEISTSGDDLNAIYWPLEDQFGGDDWLQMAAWSFHQALWNSAKQALSVGHGKMMTSTVTINDFDDQMRANLAHESWDEFRPLYGNLEPSI